MRAVNAGFDALRDRVVMPLAGLALRYRYVTLGLAGFLVLASVAPYSAGLIKYQSFPSLESDTVEARLLLVQGTPLARTQERARKVAAALEALDADLTPAQPDARPLVQSVTISYGVNADTPESGPHMATVSARLLPAGVRTTEVTEIVDRWRQLTGPMPDMAAFRITDKERGAGGKPIDLRVQGDDLAALETTARELRRFFRDFAGVREVTYDLQPGKPEFIVTLNTSAAAVLGVTARDIATELRAALRGEARHRSSRRARATRHRGAVVGRGSRQRRRSRRVAYQGARRRADPAERCGRDPRKPWLCLHHAHRRPAHGLGAGIHQPRGGQCKRVDAGAEGGLPARVAGATTRCAVDHPRRGRGHGEHRRLARRNLGLGLVAVYLVLAFLFASFVQPIVVFAAIPLSLVGAVWGHVALGLQLSLPSSSGLPPSPGSW